jgi:DNA-binding NtrC family response regulator
METQTNRRPLVLVVDDDKNTREGLERALRRLYDVRQAESAPRAMDELARGGVDVMLADLRMPGMDGLELLRRVQARHPDVVCLLLTAYGSVETAVEAMKQGAYDFLTKPVNLDHLEVVLERALQSRAMEARVEELEGRLDDKYGMERIIGQAPEMRHVFDLIRQAAPTQATILLRGASGTGKELVAQAVHRLSGRARGPFVAVHCAALSPTLLESELFGHERGAFTGATARRKGRFEQADGGTLFLDEISEIDASLQVKLLRVLETRTFERVGGEETVAVDIRLIAATNRNLEEWVKQGKFREDLYFRLNVVDIHLPTLAQRAADIPLLCDAFIREYAGKHGRVIAGMTPEAAVLLEAYAWPGNVRELRNTIEKMVVLAHSDRLGVRDVPPNIRDAVKGRAPARSGAAAGGALADIERDRILTVLAGKQQNRSQAAVELGISRRTLIRKLNVYREQGWLPETSHPA